MEDESTQEVNGTDRTRVDLPCGAGILGHPSGTVDFFTNLSHTPPMEQAESELEILFDIVRTFDKYVELRTALGPLLNILESRASLTRGMVTLLDRSTGTLKVEEAFGLSLEEKARGVYRLGEGMVGRVFETGMAVVSPDLSKESHFLNRAKNRSPRDLEGLTYYCVPIRSGGAVIGTLSAERRISGEDQEAQRARDRAFLEKVSGIIADSAKLRERILEEQFRYRQKDAEKRLLGDEGATAIRGGLPQGGRLAPGSSIIGTGSAMKQVYEMMAQVAPSDATVLITGESGTGKELVAAELHRLSKRAEAPLVKINCAALPESIIESELFGHEKGAFTGAVSRTRGRFELANEGTLFLDEIGEIDQNIQIKLLRVLQERKFERVGGEETIETDVRIVAATNKDLREEIEKGNFREDLYFRLNVVNIYVPPLRERKDDIPLLITTFLKEFAGENDKKVEGIDEKARSLLYRYEWPGNVRELRNCIESAVVMTRGPLIREEDLPPSIRTGSEEDCICIPLGLSMEDAERIIIRDTLSWCRGNQSKAAEILGLGRKTLHRKISPGEEES